jgi:hypothetical protein
LDDNAASLSISGATLPVTTPLALHAGWNWIGYLPETELPITTALSSITGRYDLVLSLDEVFDPADPGSSGLLTLQPGQGYLIRATSPATLTYPAGVSLAVSIGQATDAQTCPALSPTPYRTLLRGKLTFGGVSAPAGTRVEIITPRGELGGCTVTRQAGQYGYVQVYGEDASAPPLPGFREGEPLAFRVNGVSVVPQTSIAWHNDLSVHAVDLTAGGSKVYLPLIVR